MATTRANATVDQDCLLQLQFVHPATRVPFNPAQVRQVQVIDTDGETVLATYEPANPVTGTFTVTALAAILDAAGQYYDKWYYTIDQGDDEETATFSFTAADPTAAPTPTTPGTSTVRVEVADRSQTPAVALEGLEVLAFVTATGERVSTDTTDGSGLAHFVLYDDTGYTFSIRDPLDATKVFDENNVDHTVVDDDISNYADPNVITINGASASPPWDAGSPLDSDDLCTVSASFVDMEGLALKNVKVRVQNRFVPSIRSAKAVVGDDLVKEANSAGTVSFNLVREAQVTITIIGTGITRQVTVPDAATANLVTLLGAAEDLFTITVDDTIQLPARAA